MKTIPVMRALCALASCLSAPALGQTAAPVYIEGNQVKTADGIFVIDKSGNPFGTSINPLNIYDTNTATIANAITAPLNAQATHGIIIGSVEGATTAGSPGAYPVTVQPQAGGFAVNATPVFSAPVAYSSGTVFNATGYATVILTCTVAPGAGTIAVSPDNAGDFIGQTAVVNNASGITSTAVINVAGVYTISGHQYVQATLTGGTCFIAGGQ